MWRRGDLAKLRGRSWSDRWLLLEAALWLGVMGLAVGRIPLRRLLARLRLAAAQEASREPAAPGAERVGWAVRGAAARVPFQPTCLVSALAGAAMLRRRRMPATLTLGVAPGDGTPDPIQAHAWLRCGDQVLLGEAGAEGYTVIAQFAARSRPTPAAVQRSLLDLLRTESPPLQPGWRPDGDALDWSALACLAERHGLGALLLDRLRRRGLAALLPAETVAKLREISLLTIAQNTRVKHELRGILTACEAAAVPVIVLKGAYLVDAVYANPGARPVGDLDLLVPRHRLGAAGRVLAELGYRLPGWRGSAATWEGRHHLPPAFRPGAAAAVEVHWHIAATAYAAHVRPAELWETSVPVTVAGAPARALGPEELLLHLCVHLAYADRFSRDLRPVADITATVDRFGAALDWDALTRRASDRGWSRGVGLALGLAHRWLGAAVPEAVLTDLPSDDITALVGKLVESDVPYVAPWVIGTAPDPGGVGRTGRRMAERLGGSPLSFAAALRHRIRRYAPLARRLLLADPAAWRALRARGAVDHWLDGG
ncbi:MAG: lasso peptide biosynthesis B2 protein [Armatimonadetes bacterium]|nr:lasso peptide biosynthesis B2 protein [Armatimonadota bacterium]